MEVVKRTAAVESKQLRAVGALIVKTPVPSMFTLNSPVQLKTMTLVAPVLVSVVAIVLPDSVPWVGGGGGGARAVVGATKSGVAVKTPTRRMSCRGAVARPEAGAVLAGESEERLFTAPIGRGNVHLKSVACKWGSAAPR